MAYPAAGDGRLEALAVTLRNPPQGSGGRKLIEPLLEYAVSLDPEGKVMIPVLIDAAADKMGYSRQQANPRGKAIDLLVGYGEKAKVAIPVLQAILKSDSRYDKSQHAKAREALKAFGLAPIEDGPGN